MVLGRECNGVKDISELPAKISAQDMRTAHSLLRNKFAFIGARACVRVCVSCACAACLPKQPRAMIETCAAVL